MTSDSDNDPSQGDPEAGAEGTGEAAREPAPSHDWLEFDTVTREWRPGTTPPDRDPE